jgi:hypothetical protein
MVLPILISVSLTPGPYCFSPAIAIGVPNTPMSANTTVHFLSITSLPAVFVAQFLPWSNCYL